MLLSVFAVIGLSILLNLFNAGIRKKLVDSVKLKRIMKETKGWQKERNIKEIDSNKEKIRFLLPQKLDNY